MVLFWGMLLGLPLVAAGMLAAVSPPAASRFFAWFKRSKAVAWTLSAVAWFWTARECDIIGIEVFDKITKAFPGELWILAGVLTFLCAIWMPANLSVRALCGILMLVPAEMFKALKDFRPEQGTLFGTSDILGYAAYAGAILGMYGMFYPWRIEHGVERLLGREKAARTAGAALAAFGVAAIAAGCVLAAE